MSSGIWGPGSPAGESGKAGRGTVGTDAPTTPGEVAAPAAADAAWGEAVAELRADVRRILQQEIHVPRSGSAEVACQVFGGLCCARGRSTVDVLGELLNRLPNALSVADALVVLDRFDVALRGHDDSPSIGAVDVLPSAVFDPIVGDAPGAPASPAVDAPGAPSDEADQS